MHSPSHLWVAQVSSLLDPPNIEEQDSSTQGARAFQSLVGGGMDTNRAAARSPGFSRNDGVPLVAGYQGPDPGLLPATLRLRSS